MEAVAPPANSVDRDKRAELVLDALKLAVSDSGDHRLFRSGKLAGLFPGKTGASTDAANAAIREGLLEPVRTETKGKVGVEWVRVTPAGVRYLHDRDSPKAVLRELKAVLDAARGGLPEWMEQAKQDAAALADRFDRRAAEMLSRLDALAARVEDALRRADASSPKLTDGMSELVPWGLAAMEYLDRRPTTPCPLPELFRAVEAGSLPAFHDGLRRLHEAGAILLVPAELAEPEYATVAGGKLVGAATR